MKTIFTTSLAVLTLTCAVGLRAGEPKTISFTENKGQVCNQNFEPQSGVLFSGENNGLVYHLKKDGISYQLTKVNTWKEMPDQKTRKAFRTPDQYSIYRVDVKWMNISENCKTVTGKPLDGHTNYYLPQCPDGVLNVSTFSQVTYKNIYEGIDLKWYGKDNNLEYDFIISPNSDYKKIRLQIKGADKVSINNSGELVIQTPFGTIIEKAPVAFQENRTLNTKWILRENTVGFEVDNYDPKLPLTIDPAIRTWGTLYGGSGNEAARGSCTDQFNNVYITGSTSSNNGTTIATTGSHQTAFAGGSSDGFISKFNSSGVRQWATYYGSAGNDIGYGCAAFGGGNVYMCGVTSNTVVGTDIATAGAHQTTNNGGLYDAFLVKFNGAGARSWGTYYGGTGDDYAYSCATDAAGDIVIAGESSTTSGTTIASPGSHQPVYGGNLREGFFAKFTSAGVRIFGSYYGSSMQDAVYSCATDGSSNIYIAGETAVSGSVVAIATPGSHQPASGGGSGSYDNFLAKFNSSGVRQWGTFYGGTSGENNGYCAADASGNVYLAGTTNGSGGAISTAGSHQATFGGGLYDAYIVKFNTAGVRQWGTYYGSAQTDEALACAVDASGNSYLAGVTLGPTNISSAGSHQVTFGGGNDAFLVKFNSAGVRQYGTYYGGTGTEYGYACTADAIGNAYLAGYTTASTGTVIATASSHQTTFGGGSNDAFLVQFDECTTPTVNVTASTPSVCSGSSVTLTASGATSYTWSTGATTTTISISPTNTSVYTATGTSSGCSDTQTISITVGANPTVNISASTASVCSGSAVTMTASGASTYSWSAGATTTITSVSPTITTIYTATGTAVNGCRDTQTISVSVSANPTVNISASSPSICSGSTVSLTGSGASTYSWSTGGSGTSISVSPSVTTVYTSTGTAANGCRDTQTISVNVTTTPILSTAHYTICAGGTATLSATGAITYSWSTGATVATITVAPTSNAVYTVTGNNGSCSDVNTVSVTVGSALSIAVTPTAPSICIGSSGTLTASGATSYTWSTGSNSTAIIVSPTITTTYTISGTSGACSGSRTISVVVNANPTVAAISSSSLICTGNSATLSATGASSYNWNPGSFSGASIVVSPTINTTYTVIGSSAAGCTNTRTVSVTVSACTGITETQQANGTMNIYPNPNSGEFTIIPTEKGVYSIINSIGQTVDMIDVKEDQQSIHVSGLADGIYYVIGRSSKAKIIVNK